MADPEWRIQRADDGILMLILKAALEVGVAPAFILFYPWMLNFYMKTWTKRIRLADEGWHIQARPYLFLERGCVWHSCR